MTMTDPTAALAEARGFDPWKNGNTNAHDWADAFCTLYPDAPDADTMIGWFANAIEIGRSATNAEIARLRAIEEAARVVCDPMVEDGGGDRWWAAHDALRAALGEDR
jgi:hypothetical protein